MAHFADCKRLFQLDFIVLAAAGAFLLLVFLVLRQQRDFHRFLGRGPCFWAFMGMLLILGGLALWAVLDFSSLFTAFHRLFFPGKTNWTFDPRLDEIILIGSGSSPDSRAGPGRRPPSDHSGGHPFPPSQIQKHLRRTEAPLNPSVERGQRT